MDDGDDDVGAGTDDERSDLLRLLLNPRRLVVLGLVGARPRTAEELEAELGLRRKHVLQAVAPLVTAGLVRREGDRYELVEDAVVALAQELPGPEPADPYLFRGMLPEEHDVIARFFEGRRLVEWPMTLSKRLVVLERLALEFEPGRRYAEREVNDILRVFSDDYTTLRRALIDEGLLDRAAGEYWRSGGRVEG